MQTMKELLDAEFFPTDDEGRQLVKNFYGEVTIVAHDMPGEYPIIGVGPHGYVVQFDENGVVRLDTPVFVGGERVMLNDDLLDTSRNTLAPPDLQRIVQFVVVEPDGTVVSSYDEREAAEACALPGQQIVELDGYGYVREITEWTCDDLEVHSSDEQPSPYTIADLEAAAEKPFAGFYNPIRFSR